MTGTSEIILDLKKPFSLGTTPEDTKKACTRSRQNRIAQDMFTRWENLRSASHKLTSHLTLLWPDPRCKNESLLVNCFSKAIANSNEAFLTSGEIEEQKVFIRTITEELSHSLKITLMLKYQTGWKTHDPTNDPLEIIIKTKNIEGLTWYETPYLENEYKNINLICAARIFTMKDLELADMLG